MGNWELDKYTDSIRKEWAKSVENISLSDLMSIKMCQEIFPDYFGDDDLENLLQSVIHIEIAEKNPDEEDMYEKRTKKKKKNKIKREFKRILGKL